MVVVIPSPGRLIIIQCFSLMLLSSTLVGNSFYQAFRDVFICFALN